MTDPKQVKALIERVEKATGPDRELDRDFEILSFDAVGSHPYKHMRDIGYVLRGDGQAYCPPRYTASLDASVVFVERLAADVESVSRDDEKGFIAYVSDVLGKSWGIGEWREKAILLAALDRFLLSALLSPEDQQ